MKTKRRIWLWVFPVLLIFCLLTTILSALLNLNLPTSFAKPEELSDLDKARISEAYHLRSAFGNEVFPGFGDADLAQVIYNEEYAFVVNLINPADGWQSLPKEVQQGSAWTPLSNDHWEGKTYFRQKLLGDITPQAFAVRIGDVYAGSMTTLDWMRISLIDQFRTDLPAFLKPIFPYQLAVNTFISGSDMYISLLEHENFHAYQALWAPERFYPAEASHQLASDYPWYEEDTISAWKMELSTLQAALKSEDIELVRSLSAEFLTQREERRQKMGLSQRLINYEDNREWVEGMARYAELEIWRLANESISYEPVDMILDDPIFNEYMRFESRWKREVDQISRTAGDEGDGRFYYSGMAQAYLLDRLDPDWKNKLFENPDLSLTDLLEAAVSQ